MRQPLRTIIRVCLSALLFVTLLPVLFAGLTLWRMNDTILRAEYYAVPLHESGIYEFLMTDAVLSALDEYRTDEDLIEDSLRLSNERLASLAYSMHPPGLVREKVEYILSKMGRYVMGEKDSFSMSILPGLKQETVVSELQVLLRDLDAYELFQDQLVVPMMDEAIEGTLVEEIGIPRTEVREAVLNVLHREWFEAQADMMIVIITPYVLGREDGFRASGSLEDRVEAAMHETKLLLRESGSYERIRTEGIEYMVARWVPLTVDLSYKIVLTPEEVKSALEEVAPLEWIRTETERVIDESVPFATGRTNSLVLEVDLRDRKRRAKEIVRATATRKFDEKLASLPACHKEMTPAELTAALSGKELECAPTGYDAVAMRGAPEAVALAAATTLDENVPDVFVLSLAQEDLDYRLREAIWYARNGWQFTDEDLKQALSGDSLSGLDNPHETLESIRELMSGGWTYNHIEFRRDLSHSDVIQLDRDRRTLESMRRLRWVLLLAPVPVAAIGLVVGGDWRRRLFWMSVAVVLASLATLWSIGPFSDAVLAPYLEDVLGNLVSELFQGIDFPRTESLVASKVSGVAQIAVSYVTSGVALYAIVSLGVGVLGLAVLATFALADYGPFKRRRTDEQGNGLKA